MVEELEEEARCLCRRSKMSLSTSSGHIYKNSTSLIVIVLGLYLGWLELIVACMATSVTDYYHFVCGEGLVSHG